MGRPEAALDARQGNTFSRRPSRKRAQVVFLPSIFYTMVKGKAMDECGATSFVATLLYALGSALSTVSEYQRYVFKKDPTNKGKLMTGGLGDDKSVGGVVVFLL